MLVADSLLNATDQLCSLNDFFLFVSFSISENFLTVKGAALFLPCGNGSSPSSVPRITQRRNKHTGTLFKHTLDQDGSIYNVFKRVLLVW